jgi:hypothetical protein
MGDIGISPFLSLTEDLVLQISSFLPASDLLEFQCVSRDISLLKTDALWRNLCEKRWASWPRFQLTEKRQEELDKTMPTCSWKDRYRIVEKEATRTELKPCDLQDLNWYLSFVLSGVRGESRSDFMKVHFMENNILYVPGYPPLPYEIRNEPPPNSASQIRKSQRGDRPFSTKQWLDINNFPPHFITRKLSSAEWLIVNDNVIFVSSRKE